MNVEELISRARFWKDWPPEERKRIRTATGVSLREAAEAIGVSHAAYRMWENGTHLPQQDEHDLAYRQLLQGLKDILES